MTISKEEIAAIRKRLADAGNEGMHSACGEYECDCHRDIPRLLEVIEGMDEVIGKAVEEEREGCARQADQWEEGMWDALNHDQLSTLKMIAREIRARQS